MQVSTLAARFLAWASKCRRPSTVYVYRHYFLDFATAVGDMPAADVTPATLTAWAKTWHQCQAIKRLFAWAVNEAMLLPSNPIARVKHPPKGRRRRVMTPCELAALLRRSKPDLRALLIGYRETLARPQELRVATWDDVIADDGRESLRSAIAAGRASIVLWEYKDRERRQLADMPRVLLLSPRFRRELVRLYDRRSTRHGPIFETAAGRQWTANALRCRFRRLRARLAIVRDKRGETIVPYTFRHTGATGAAALGVRDRLLADVLGHVEVRTTHRYTHLSVGHLRDGMAAAWRRSPAKHRER